jgi:ceramide glucosyltransferase
MGGALVRPTAGVRASSKVAGCLDPEAVVRSRSATIGDYRDLFPSRLSGKAQLVFGAQHPNDNTILVVESLIERYPDLDLHLVVNSAAHGANREISNLINMGQVSRHPLIVMADSDVAVGPNYLRTLAGALAQSGVGVVTCLYRGLPRAASGRDCFPWQCTIISCPARSWARARPGPAMRWRDHCFVAGHSNQDRGFRAAANQLADDYAIGQTVRQAGLRIVVSPMLVAHTFEEKSLSDLLRHELRWARTIFTVDPVGHIGSSVTHALPLE